ncbi:MAG: mannitol-specific PTS transporter subunit IIC [Dysgonamonadaceae bacterium]|jgi:PTS system mannitol-specific IIC component|nr:mannitol-specific PTS transporter subunit IIC [Dysgonamonadaceae bacterium]
MVRKQLQSFGSKLSAMIMPNIGAFIAWGLITAVFIPAGWYPNAELAKLVTPMLHYLLPLLIGYTAGSNVAGLRGGVTGAIATTGVIAGSDVPMFLGAMAMGPLAGYLIKWFDGLIKDKVKPGFEMLANNFSAGILGMVCAIAGFLVIGPVMLSLTQVLNAGVELILDKGLLPLIALFLEPGKVLFLNNAINHGILTPLGIEQVRETGSSILFLLETNPGPGLGVLLAYAFLGNGDAGKSAPASSIILFFGGIHEIYFPYILMRPVLIVATILGSASAMAYYQVVGSGLVSAASPGSILSIMAMSPRGAAVSVAGGIVIAALVSFLVACFFVRGAGRKSLEEAKQEKAALKDGGKVPRKIVFACEAGMGSSAMGAAAFRKRIGQEGLSVTNTSVAAIPPDTDVVVCQAAFAERVHKRAPAAEMVVIEKFLSDPALEALAARFFPAVPVLKPESVVVGAKDENKEDVIRRVGELLVRGGYAGREYIAGMLERERMTSTYIGLGVAVPHGTSESRRYVRNSGIAVVQYPEGVDFDGEKAYIVAGIAATDDSHLEILSSLSEVLNDEERLEKIKTTNDPMCIYQILSTVGGKS